VSSSRKWRRLEISDGAKMKFFRHERDASALPPPGFDYLGRDDEYPNNKYGLRLYCIRLNSSIVILFNGDLKTAQEAQKCKNCKRHFDLANRITRKIDEALRERVITLGYKELIGLEQFEIEI
jgi:hypothetical protein